MRAGSVPRGVLGVPAPLPPSCSGRQRSVLTEAWHGRAPGVARLHRGTAQEGTGAATAALTVPRTSFNPSGSGWSFGDRQDHPRVLVLT